MITFRSFLNFLLPKQLSILGAVTDFLGLSPTPPPTPDFEAAAEATAAGNLEAAEMALEANRYDITSPLGSQTWTSSPIQEFDEAGYNQALAEWEQQSLVKSPGPAPTKEQFTTERPNWEKVIDLTPEGQELFDKNISTQMGMADIGLLGLGQMRDIFGQPFQLDQFGLKDFQPGDFEGYREDVYDAMLSRLETDIERDRQAKEAQLIAAGIGRGTEAYGREQERFDRRLEDARLQAYQSATDQALRERQQLFRERQQDVREDMNLRARLVEEALLRRQTPLNELSAFRTGSQVQMPSFEVQAPMANVGGPDYLGAMSEQAEYDLAGYNADVMAQNAILGGLFDLGGGYLAGR